MSDAFDFTTDIENRLAAMREARSGDDVPFLVEMIQHLRRRLKPAIELLRVAEPHVAAQIENKVTPGVAEIGLLHSIGGFLMGYGAGDV